MREARDAALGFLGHYRRYARVASRRKAEEPRKAQSKYEQLNRDLAEANRDFGEAEERLGEIGAKIETLDETEAAQREHQQALRDSKAMDSARDLESARTAAAKATESAAKVELLCNDARDEAHRRQDRVDDAQTALDAVRTDATRFGTRPESPRTAPRLSIGTSETSMRGWGLRRFPSCAAPPSNWRIGRRRPSTT